MNTILIATLALILAAVPASARIGETVEQCEKRYGKAYPVRQSSDTMFRKNGFDIVVSFYAGKCDSIYYIKNDGGFNPITEEEQQILRESNAEGWRPILANEHFQIGSILHKTANHTAARYDLMSTCLQIATYDCLMRKEAARKAKETKNLKGF